MCDQWNATITFGNWRQLVFKPLVKKVGLPDDVTPYTLRHSANTWMGELGVRTEVRAGICGHSEEINEQVYLHDLLAAQREALEKLGTYLQ